VVTVKETAQDDGADTVLTDDVPMEPLTKMSLPAATTVSQLEALLHPVERRRKVGGRRQADAQLRRELAHAHAQRAAALEAERKRMARELHDGIGQSLATIKFRVENAVALMRRGRLEAGIEMLDATVLQIREALAEVRRIARDLRPSLLDELGLVQAVAWLCREFEATHPTTRVEQVIGLHEAIVPKAVGAAIFRVLQEALTNIAKHARADRVLVRLNGSGDGIELVVQDNGQGFDPAHRVDGGCGLISMRERTELSGGRFSVQSGLCAGTVVRCAWGRGTDAVTA
jgi:two-component system NarL family sensor kinase